MGLGGHLIWSGVLENLYEEDGCPPIVCKKPSLTDLLKGFKWDRNFSFEDDQIFKFNDRIAFTKSMPKTELSKFVDRLFLSMVGFFPLRNVYENFILNLSRRHFLKHGERLVHLDLLCYSYAKKQTKKKMIWKSGGHAAQVIGFDFGLSITSPNCYMRFSQNEILWLEKFLISSAIEKKFIIIEPGTNTDWFGELRAWPNHKWVQLVGDIKKQFSDLQVIQIGLKETHLLPGVFDLREKISFREACLLLSQSALFIGTEGGLMHAAKATNTKALILWGGVTLPAFAGYPQSQHVICNYVSCAPCGNLGWCDNDNICMNSIEVSKVFEHVKSLLRENK